MSQQGLNYIREGGWVKKIQIIWLYTRSTHHFSVTRAASGKSESRLGTINQVTPFGFGHGGIPTLASFTLSVYSFEIIKCLHLPLIIYGFVPRPKRGFCEDPLQLPSSYRPKLFLGPFNPGHTMETRAEFELKEWGKVSWRYRGLSQVWLTMVGRQRHGREGKAVQRREEWHSSQAARPAARGQRQDGDGRPGKTVYHWRCERHLIFKGSKDGRM